MRKSKESILLPLMGHLQDARDGAHYVLCTVFYATETSQRLVEGALKLAANLFFPKPRRSSARRR